MAGDAMERGPKSKVPIDEAKRLIMAIFEETRQTSGAAVKSANFLTFLLDPPPLSISNSWKGARRKAAFFRKVEAHFLITFPTDAYDRNWNFDSFCAWVVDRSKKRKVNRKLAERNRRNDFGCLLQLVLAIGALAAVRLWQFGIGDLLAWLVMVLPIAVGWILLSSYRHNSRLAKQLED